MPGARYSVVAADEDATARLAEALAAILVPGDLVTLSGDLGVGKTSFARSLIRWLADDRAREVASPTFALSHYHDDLPIPLVHCDFYRLRQPAEAAELGLVEALDTGIVVVEWPDRGELPGAATYDVTLEQMDTGSARAVEIVAAPAAAPALRRLRRVRDFLAGAGFGAIPRSRLQGDASTRRYERLHGEPRLILMDAPRQPDGPPVRDSLSYSRLAHLAEEIASFVGVAGWLKDRGLCVPDIIACDLDLGLAVISDLGDNGVVDDNGAPLPERYRVAVDCLLAVHRHSAPDVVNAETRICPIQAYDSAVGVVEAELFAEWFAPEGTNDLDDIARLRFLDAWRAVLDDLPSIDPVLVLRDFHSPNLIWRAARQGTDRIGLIDFQDALAGHPAYDVVSLCQDARVTVPQALEADLLARYRHGHEAAFDWDAFLAAYAVLGAQRATKVLGIFVRLFKRDGKPAYLRHLPRVGVYLDRNLVHPALAPVAAELHEMFAQRPLATVAMEISQRFSTVAK